MQPDSPYQLVEMLGSCQVGSVWSAIDLNGESLTVAVLDATVAGDQRWRDAFTAAANEMAPARTGEPAFRYADFTAATPWVACGGGTEPGAGSGAERVFLALGMNYQPLPPDFSATSTADGPAGAHPVSATPAGGDAAGPVSTPDLPPSGNPWSEPFQRAPHQPVSGPPQPISGTPGPVSGTPGSPAFGPYPPAGPSRYEPFPQPSTRFPPSAPPRRRRGLWLGVGTLVLVLLVGGGGAFAWRWSANGDPIPPAASPTDGNTATATAALPTASPLYPGVEPPRPGQWPDQWPGFLSTDRIRTLNDLAGLGFTLKVPVGWECVPGGQDAGMVTYQCGAQSPQVGGEVVVRDCPDDCPESRRTAMRQAEEAWGLEWIRVGEYTTYAESSTLQVDGEQRYGLVIIGYWRGGNDGTLDRQIVVRMTAPVERAGQLRRVANYLRDTLIL